MGISTTVRFPLVTDETQRMSAPRHQSICQTCGAPRHERAVLKRSQRAPQVEHLKVYTVPYAAVFRAPPTQWAAAEPYRFPEQSVAIVARRHEVPLFPAAVWSALCWRPMDGAFLRFL